MHYIPYMDPSGYMYGYLYFTLVVPPISDDRRCKAPLFLPVDRASTLTLAHPLIFNLDVVRGSCDEWRFLTATTLIRPNCCPQANLKYQSHIQRHPTGSRIETLETSILSNSAFPEIVSYEVQATCWPDPFRTESTAPYVIFAAPPE